MHETIAALRNPDNIILLIHEKNILVGCRSLALQKNIAAERRMLLQ
jgi:hypothetical protein